MGQKTGDAVSRRDFLTMTTAAMGVCGLGISAIPFIRAMSPTKDIVAAGVMEVDISGIKEGDFRVFMWRKQPVFILRRTKAMIDGTDRMNASTLRDPAMPSERVKRPDWLVCIGICTHLGCIPIWHPKGMPGFDEPGFYCSCHGGKYDTLGRRLDGPPPENLHLVPYAFEKNGNLRIGAVNFAGYDNNIRRLRELPAA